MSRRYPSMIAPEGHCPASPAPSGQGVSGERERNLEAQRQTIEACARVADRMNDGLNIAGAIRRLLPNESLAAPAPSCAPGEVERVTPALHEGGRFLQWSSVDLAAQCLAQAREQLDPEFSQFMTAVAARLSVQRAAPKMDRVAVAQIIDPTAWRNIDGYSVEQVHSGEALRKADAILAALSPQGLDAKEGDCTCQRYPTHQANDCPLHGLDEPTYTAGERVDAGSTPSQRLDAAPDRATVELCIHILRGNFGAGRGPEALQQRDDDIAILQSLIGEAK